MRLMALTFGDENTASTYFRVLQYEPLFQAAGITLHHTHAKTFTDFTSLGQYDVVLLQKTILSRGTVRQIRRHAKRLVYDVDDRIWIRPNRPYDWWTRRRLDRRLRHILAQADTVTVANRVLVDDCRALGGQAEVFPMALDGEAWVPHSQPRNGPLVIGWTGFPVSLPFLQSVWPVLQEVQQKHPDTRVQLHTPEDPHWNGVQYEFVPHVPNDEPDVIRQFDIGLLPLDDTPSARGKSPCKTLQYFASGAAVVCSPVGATMDMATDDTLCRHATTPAEWATALEELITQHDTRRSLAAAGRATFEERFDTHVVFNQILKLWGLDHPKPAA
tara:strand:+ start:813 stop:1802 length:990 start_codon:yes stop_codon:yes gene_type:complete